MRVSYQRQKRIIALIGERRKCRIKCSIQCFNMMIMLFWRKWSRFTLLARGVKSQEISQWHDGGPFILGSEVGRALKFSETFNPSQEQGFRLESSQDRLLFQLPKMKPIQQRKSNACLPGNIKGSRCKYRSIGPTVQYSSTRSMVQGRRLHNCVCKRRWTRWTPNDGSARAVATGS